MSNILQMRSRTLEISDRLLAGAAAGELLPEYSQKWGCSERTVERLIAFAKDKIFGNLNNKESVMDSLRTETLFDFLNNSMLSTMEIEARLCAIASGNITMDRVVKGKEGAEIQSCAPSASEQLKAMSLLLKLRGKLTGDDSGWQHRQPEGITIIARNEAHRQMIENT